MNYKLLKESIVKDMIAEEQDPELAAWWTSDEGGNQYIPDGYDFSPEHKDLDNALNNLYGIAGETATIMTNQDNGPEHDKMTRRIVFKVKKAAAFSKTFREFLNKVVGTFSVTGDEDYVNQSMGVLRAYWMSIHKDGAVAQEPMA